MHVPVFVCESTYECVYIHVVLMSKRYSLKMKHTQACMIYVVLIATGIEVSRDRIQSLEGINNGGWRDFWHVLFSEENLKGIQRM